VAVELAVLTGTPTPNTVCRLAFGASSILRIPVFAQISAYRR